MVRRGQPAHLDLDVRASRPADHRADELQRVAPAGAHHAPAKASEARERAAVVEPEGDRWPLLDHVLRIVAGLQRHLVAAIGEGAGGPVQQQPRRVPALGEGPHGIPAIRVRRFPHGLERAADDAVARPGRHHEGHLRPAIVAVKEPVDGRVADLGAAVELQGAAIGRLGGRERQVGRARRIEARGTGPVGPLREARGRVMVGGRRRWRVHQRHQPGEGQGGNVRADHVRRIAGDARNRDRAGLQRHVRDRAGVPANVEEALAVDHLFVAVAVHVLRHAEGDVGNLEQRHPLRHVDGDAAAERADPAIGAQLLEQLRRQFRQLLAQHFGRIAPAARQPGRGGGQRHGGEAARDGARLGPEAPRGLGARQRRAASARASAARPRRAPASRSPEARSPPGRGAARSPHPARPAADREAGSAAPASVAARVGGYLPDHPAGPRGSGAGRSRRSRCAARASAAPSPHRSAAPRRRNGRRRRSGWWRSPRAGIGAENTSPRASRRGTSRAGRNPCPRHGRWRRARAAAGRSRRASRPGRRRAGRGTAPGPP
jgi:hypothetical protein